PIRCAPSPLPNTDPTTPMKLTMVANSHRVVEEARALTNPATPPGPTRTIEAIASPAARGGAPTPPRRSRQPSRNASNPRARCGLAIPADTTSAAAPAARCPPLHDRLARRRPGDRRGVHDPG